jgi:hypothetical protein
MLLIEDSLNRAVVCENFWLHRKQSAPFLTQQFQLFLVKIQIENFFDRFETCKHKSAHGTCYVASFYGIENLFRAFI